MCTPGTAKGHCDGANQEDVWVWVCAWDSVALWHSILGNFPCLCLRHLMSYEEMEHLGWSYGVGNSTHPRSYFFVNTTFYGIWAPQGSALPIFYTAQCTVSVDKSQNRTEFCLDFLLDYAFYLFIREYAPLLDLNLTVSGFPDSAIWMLLITHFQKYVWNITLKSIIQLPKYNPPKGTRVCTDNRFIS